MKKIVLFLLAFGLNILNANDIYINAGANFMRIPLKAKIPSYLVPAEGSTFYEEDGIPEFLTDVLSGNISYSYANPSFSNVNTDAKNHINAASVGVAYDLTDAIRVGFNYNQANGTNNLSVKGYQLVLDYFIFDMPIIKPFVGASIGYLDYRVETRPTVWPEITDKIKINDKEIGLRVGMEYPINKTISANIVYEYKKVDAKCNGDSTLESAGGDWDQIYEYNIDSYTTLGVKLYYKF